MDFVIQKADKIYPIEVKSGLNKNIKSLRSYANRYKAEVIFRTSPRNLKKDADLINIPLYAISIIDNFIE